MKEQKPKRAILTPEELVLFEQYMGMFLSVADAARDMNLHRNKLDRFILAKSSSPETVHIIRAALITKGLLKEEATAVAA